MSVFKTSLSAPLVVSVVLYTFVKVILSIGRSRKITGVGTHLENQSLVHVYVSLEILVRTPLERQLEPLGPIASRGRFVRPSVNYADD